MESTLNQWTIEQLLKEIARLNEVIEQFKADAKANEALNNSSILESPWNPSVANELR